MVSELCEEEEDAAKIRELQSAVEEAWNYTVVQRHGHSPCRVFRLLLLLPHVRRQALNSIAHIFELKQEASIPMRDLLCEMMEGHKPKVHTSPSHSPPHTDTQTSHT